MFSSGNCGVPITMNVEPAGAGYNNGGMGGWGDGGWWVLIILFALFGWGGNGWGGGFGGGNGAGVQGALTRGELCQDMNFQSLENAVGRLSDNQALQFTQLNNGMCNLGYQNAQLVNGVQMQIANEARTTDNAICNLGTAMQQGNFALQQAINADTVANMQNTNAISRQLSDCCCENRQAIAQVRYDMATQACDTRNTIQNTTRDIIDNQNANSRQILDFLVNDKISALQSENQSLKLAASQAAQNSYLISELKPCPQPAYITCNPFTGQYGGYGYGYNNGCGCGNNSGCGCC